MPQTEDHIRIKSNLFQVIEGEDDETNPGIYGKELAKWLASQLQEAGQPKADAFAEDFGWIVLCHHPHMAICSSDFNDPHSEDEERKWLIYTTTDSLAPIARIKDWLGVRNLQKERTALHSEILQILQREERIQILPNES